MVQCLGHEQETWETEIYFPALPQTSCVTLGKLLSLPVPQSPIYNMRIIALPCLIGEFYVVLVWCSATMGMGAIDGYEEVEQGN